MTNISKMLPEIKVALANLLTPGERCLIGVSGGADSVALLHALIELGFQPHVCHVNHLLRGDSSDGDANFVRELATRCKLSCEINTTDVSAYAKKGHLSLEDAARQVRYNFFSTVAVQTGIRKLLLAHTADDQAETVLLRLIRGAGPSGLAGIWPRRQIGTLQVIRPLITVSRTDILKFLSTHNLSYREDLSNLDTRFTRNRIRLELLPLLESRFNPSIRESLLQTATILHDEDSYLDEIIMREFYEQTILDDMVHVSKFSMCPVPIQRRLLRLWFSKQHDALLGLGYQHIEAVRSLAMSASTHGELHLPSDLVVYREYELLKKQVGQRKEIAHQNRWPISLDGETLIQELNLRLLCTPHPSTPKFQDNRHIEYFDSDKLGSDLFVRTWQEGDRLQPLGMKQSKKLQDLFVDEKMPIRKRSNLPILCRTDGCIVWVIGVRIADPFKVTEITKNVLQIRVESVRC